MLLLDSGTATTTTPTLSPPPSTAIAHLLPTWIQPWVPLLLGGALVIVAALIHRFDPEKRNRLRAAVRLYVLYLLVLGVRVALAHFGDGSLVTQVGWIESLAGGLLAALLVNTTVFDLTLGRTTLQPPKIMTDFAIGISYIAVFFHALNHAGVALTSLFATSAVASAIIGFSIAPTIGSLLGGLFLQLDKSIQEGDWVQLDNKLQGQVKAIRWRHTVIETRDWDTVLVPNTALLSANITVFGRRDGHTPQRRIAVYFNVDHRWSPSEVIACLDEALQRSTMPHVSSSPAPHCVCVDFARDQKDSFACYAVRYFQTDLSDDTRIASAMRERIYAALRRAGIPLAMPGTAVFVSMDDEASKQKKQHRELDRRIEMLRALDLFGGFNDDELKILAEQLVAAPFAKGEVITEQGRVAHWLYILSDGRAEVRVQTAEGTSELVRQIQAPDFFGEMAVMVGSPRMATVVACTPVHCYRLGRDAFSKILTDRPVVVKFLAEILARRRVELDAARERLDDKQRQSRMAAKHDELLGQIRAFFGLD